MIPIGIALVNRSTVPGITPLFLKLIAAACHSQLCKDVGPAHGKTPIPVVYAESVDAAPPGYSIGYFIDTDADVPDALAFHTENTDGSQCIFVLVKTILANGGTLSEGVNSVATSCSHEVVEMFGNPSVNDWCDRWDGTESPRELCDSVEGDSYDMEVSVDGASGQVPVSNFVYPDYFDPQAPKTAVFDHLRKLDGPFEIRPDGYMEVRTTVDKSTQVWGDNYPKWKKELKATVGRAARARSRKLAATSARSAPDTIPGPMMSEDD